MKRYLVYHARWQVSALVMYPVMHGLSKMGLPLLLNLSIGQFFGALIFYYIDKRIFQRSENRAT